MKRATITGVVAIAILATAGALLFRRHYHLTFLTSSELTLREVNLAPPPQPVTFQTRYSEMARVLCGKLEPLIDTNICDVVRLPELFADKCIRVTGRFETDGFEHSVIIDESCSEQGLVPWTTKEADNKKSSLAELEDAIWNQGRAGTLDKRVTARFTGRFVWKPNAKHAARVLEISSLSNLKVQRLGQSHR